MFPTPIGLYLGLFLATTNVLGTQVTDVQGPAFKSSLVGQTIHNLTGIVTAKGPNGFWISGAPVADPRVSNGLSIFTQDASVIAQVAIGDMVSLSGRVAEFRSNNSPNDLTITEIDNPTEIEVASQNNAVVPVIVGKDRSPPTQQLSALDTGSDGFLAVPNNSSRIDITDATLQPDKFGMDFWESLEGQLVTIPKPVALDFPNSFGEIWVRGDWAVTGLNSRGGLTITLGPDGRPDANPEAVIVGRPLDGTRNPKAFLGVGLSDITGVVAFQFGFFYVLPLSAPSIISTPTADVPVTTILSSDTDECTLTIGDYNVDNMTPRSPTHVNGVAKHITTFLRNPDIVFLQEIQDNTGSTDDGIVVGNLTLSALTTAIASISGVRYDFIEIAPINNEDGGEPGGNIRQAYIFKPENLQLVSGSPAGGSLDSTAVVSDVSGGLTFSFNPGRVDPTNAAWIDSRKPLAAAWQTTSGHRFFTVNLHLTSKSGSASTQGDARLPVNLGVDQRTSQIERVSAFVRTILAEDTNANIVVAGDFNEYVQTRSAFTSLQDILFEADELAGVDPVERYTFLFDQNSEQLDHIFVSNAIKGRGVDVEHIHVNNWANATTVTARPSDHDPSIAEIHLC
ncbi:hypothetical protein PLEOSDRAFT_1106723 [Pleurotus ostreatus PC15]|uniref:Endonuclease/exonuclease/phosphatase domain-containing protein n=1 Tax=Pleurotus ostreatus (strain PC15) TaxID=1137138 RepID=A0A067NQF0_PLEO1|nr:hypothetical protein PLEOSDRAFT_1106723 [Pleurotus ostreatus PC15]